MARKGFKVLDSDMHIIEPPDLWQRYIDPEFKDQAPRGLTETVGDLRLIGPDGKPWGRDAVAVRDQQRGRGQSFAQNQIRFKPYEERGWTGEVQLGAMDEEGIDVAVIYPSRGLFALTIPAMDPRLAAAVARGYNNWLYDFCQADHTRLIGAGMISPFLMWRMDEHWERTGDVHAPELKMAPSQYWKRQCFASAEADEEPVKYVIDYLGNGGLVFSTDFPHGDSKFPPAVERFLQIDMPDEDKRKILWDNCASYYG